MRLRHLSTTLFLSFLCILPAAAAERETLRVSQSADVLETFLAIPESSIPPALLAQAHAVAVVPDMLNLGLGVGGRHGKGILVVRRDDGTWSNPSFVKMTGGSFGFQFGAQATDVILVFRTSRSVDGITNGKLTLGVDASVAAGPVGRQTGAHTDMRFRSEVLSYSRSKGFFAGIALEGAGLSMDRLANAEFYQDPAMTPERIFASPGNIAPDAANRFVQVLSAQTGTLAASSTTDAGAAAVVEPAPERPSTVRTFAMPDPDAAEAAQDGVPQ